MLKRLDIYIIKKFLGTYFLSITLIIAISVVFDLTEKIDNFVDKEAPINAIIFDYYVNFIPHFMNLFSSLFTFIAVIFFTSKLAYNTEIIAMLSGGISFRRLMRPYLLAASVIMIMSYLLASYVIPPANVKRLDFENKYVSNQMTRVDRNIHVEVSPGLFVYIEYFNAKTLTGSKGTIEKFENGRLVSKTTADRVKYIVDDTIWRFYPYVTRTMGEMEESITKGRQLDTTLDLSIDDFVTLRLLQETLTNKQLDEHIERQNRRGVGNVEPFVIERQRRYSDPFSTIILTIIGVSVSSRKLRGGTGLHIGLGLAISFSYILFSRISQTFAINGTMAPALAVWLPNILYSLVAYYMYWRAPK